MKQNAVIHEYGLLRKYLICKNLVELHQMLMEKGMAGNQSQLYEVYFYKVEGSKNICSFNH